MEGRAHSGKNYISQDPKSRMLHDFASCSEHFVHHFKQRQAARFKDGSDDPSRKDHDIHVGIIGAGLAGLRCAEVLVEEGLKVTIIEARDRLGGRVCQSTLLGSLVDMGPNWIHGTDNNPMLDLAGKSDSKLSSLVGNTNVYDSNGTLMESQEVMDRFEVFWDIVEAAFKHSNENCENIASNLSLKDYFREKLRASNLDENAQYTVMELAEMWGGFIGDLFEKQSLKWVWLEECLDGDDLFMSDTHRPIINHFAEALKTHADIRLSTIVQSIESNFKKRRDEKVVVKTTNGSFDFDEVIVTIPLGCLKMGTLGFVPDLPPDIDCAITSASYSRLEKVLLAFPFAFWETSSETTAGISEATLVAKHTFPVFTHFLHPTYVPEEQKSWTVEMVALSSPAVFGALAKPVLLFYLWGPSATQLATAIADLTPSSDAYRRNVDTLFRPFYSRLPNYIEDHPDCVPSAVLATNWQNDDFAGRGTYTNFKTPPEGTQAEGDPRIDDGVRAMRNGMPERGIWFAGEHTAPFVALGTSTGACWSGEAAATKIIEAYWAHS